MKNDLSKESKALVTILDGELNAESEIDHALQRIQSLIKELLCDDKAAITIRNAVTIGGLLAYHIDPTEKSSKGFLKYHKAYYEGCHKEGNDFFPMEVGSEDKCALVYGTMYCLTTCQSVSHKYAAVAAKLANRIDRLGLIPQEQEVEGPCPIPPPKVSKT